MDKAIFIKQLDRPAIEQAIARAEALTSGEIRIAITQQPTGNPIVAAQKVFMEMAMNKTTHRNAVLIFVAPSSQTFAVVGDEGVHQKCGETFWQELTATMSGHFKKNEFTAGLVQGIERARVLLATHFPRQPDDKNELPDKVIES